jgi:hypothetical protein
VHDPVRELAVVRQEDQPEAVLVEPTDRVDPPLPRIGDEVDGSWPRLARFVRADDARGLVQEVVPPPGLLRPQDDAVDLDLLSLRIDPQAELRRRLAVDADLPGRDQAVRLPPRRDAVVGQELVQAHEVAAVGLGSALGALGRLRARAGGHGRAGETAAVLHAGSFVRAWSTRKAPSGSRR